MDFFDLIIKLVNIFHWGIAKKKKKKGIRLPPTRKLAISPTKTVASGRTKAARASSTHLTQPQFIRDCECCIKINKDTHKKKSYGDRRNFPLAWILLYLSFSVGTEEGLQSHYFSLLVRVQESHFLLPIICLYALYISCYNSRHFPYLLPYDPR